MILQNFQKSQLDLNGFGLIIQLNDLTYIAPINFELNSIYDLKQPYYFPKYGYNVEYEFKLTICIDKIESIQYIKNKKINILYFYNFISDIYYKCSDIKHTDSILDFNLQNTRLTTIIDISMIEQLEEIFLIKSFLYLTLKEVNNV